MSEMNKENKAELRGLRRLKISTRHRYRGNLYYRDSYTIPELRLSGSWLAAAGFISDSYVEVEVRQNELRIKLQETPF